MTKFELFIMLKKNPIFGCIPPKHAFVDFLVEFYGNDKN